MELLQFLLGLSQLLRKLFAASAGAVSASVGAILASARVVVICVEAVAVFVGVVFGVFD